MVNTLRLLVCPMNLIFDTNIILDILVFKNPDSCLLWDTILKGENSSFCSHDTLSELKVVLSRPIFNLPPKNQQLVVEEFLSHSRLVEIEANAPCKCKDPEDQKFIGLAFTLAPSKLVTRDKKILKCAKKLRKHSVEIEIPGRNK